MSYTLRGRLESRLAALLVPLLAACVLAATLPAWWPLELAALMLGAALALDALVYDRVLDYQHGWLALPLGLLELGVLMILVRALSIDAPLGGAVAFFAGSWLFAQALGQAGLPLLRLSYAEDGGELGRLGPALTVVVLVTFAAAGGVAWATRPHTLHLASGVHQGPLVVDRRENVVGARGAVVRGGIVVRASHVTIRNVSVVGGDNGIDVESAHDVVLDGVNVVGAREDGIHVRRSQVTIRNCAIDSPGGYTQGIDISFSMGLEPSTVEGCTVTGGREGIVVDSSNATVMGNRVSATDLRAISMNEMAMGMVEQNQVAGALGVGIFCGDRSECTIDGNRVSGTRADRASGDLSRMGSPIQSHFGSVASLSGNELVGNAAGVSAFAGAQIEQR
jgi:parallel beta-helix repeat protein